MSRVMIPYFEVLTFIGFLSSFYVLKICRREKKYSVAVESMYHFVSLVFKDWVIRSVLSSSILQALHSSFLRL